MPDAAHPLESEPLYLPDEQLRLLIDEQFPHLAERELGRRYTLEDHFAIRIGDDYGALFPRYADRDYLYERAPELIRPQARAWTFPASFPIAGGEPGHGYPCHWTLVEWVSASTAGFVPLHADSAAPFGSAIRQIHTKAPADAATNPHTSVSLSRLARRFEELLSRAAASGAPEQREIDADATRTVFERGIAAPMDVDPTWTHGRLEPRAVLSDRGQFAGVLQWHNYGSGDPAADLGYATNLLPRTDHQALYDAYGAISAATHARIGAFQVFAALRHVSFEDPFVMRLAWERLLEMDLAAEA
ncbi:phosphotransferase [Demequina oxidasica]|uniref:phosphotransferase n=1 Tax=Demequina oxidasica TaxID=676199 RepID=UPI000786254B|nr:phosphotransferase [Demequina oxidasica]